MATTKAAILFTRTQAGSFLDSSNGINVDGVNVGLRTSTRIVISGDTSPTFDPSNNDASLVAFDAPLGTYYAVLGSFQSPNFDYNIYSGSIASGTITATPIYTPLTQGQVNLGYAGFINDIVDDPVNHQLYFTQQIIDDNFEFVSAGIYVMPEAGSASPTKLNIPGVTDPNVLAIDAIHNLIFFTQSTNGKAGTPEGFRDGASTYVESLQVFNTVTGNVSTLLTEPYAPDAQSGTDHNGGPLLNGIAVDAATETLVFTTNNPNNPNGTVSGTPIEAIYKTTYSPNATTATIGPITTLYSGAASFDPSSIKLDVPDSVFYVSGNTVLLNSGYFAANAAIYEGSLAGSSAAAMAEVTPLSETAGDTSVSGGEQIPDIAVDVAPGVTAGATVTWAPGNAAVTVDPGLTITAQTSPSFTGATVSITGGQTGDVLAVTPPNGITASFNVTTFVLTVSGAGTLAQYQQILAAVQYHSTASDPTAGGTATSRTLAYALSDGLVTGGATSTVQLPSAPIVTAGSAVTFAGGGSAVVTDAGLTIQDSGVSTLVGATVAIGAGRLSGDIIGFTAQNGISGAFDSATAVLTLSGTATLAAYQLAIRSITYGFSPANADPTNGNTDTSRTISYTVNDGTSVSTAASSVVTVTHTAPSVAAGANAIYITGGDAVAADPALSVTAPDSSGLVSAATIAITTNRNASDALNFTDQNGIAGSYSSATGVLTLAGTATAAEYQTAIESITFSSLSTSSIAARTITYQVNDGTLASSTVTSSVTVQHPTPAIAGALAGQAILDTAIANPFSGVTITDSANQLDSATITLTASGMPTDADGSLSGSAVVKSGIGTYTLAAASPVSLTASLAALVFTPTARQVPTGQTVATGFSLSISDTGAGSAIDTTTSVVVTASLPPAPTDLALSPASDSGTLLDGITDIATPVITGSGVIGDTITLFDGAIQIGTSIVVGGGIWAVTSSVLNLGSHTLTAVQSDADTTGPASTGLTLTIAAVPLAPVELTLAPASDSGMVLDGITDIATPVITGTGVAGETIALFDGLLQVGTGAVGGDGTWSVTTGTLAIGVHTLTAVQSDPAGNPSPRSTGLGLTIAAVPAAAAGLALAPGSDSGTLLDSITDIATPLITGSGVAGDTIALFDGASAGGTAIVGDDGTWSITTGMLAVGSHTLTAVQTDPAGNPSPASAGLALTIANVPAAPASLALAPITDSGTVLDGITDIATPVITGTGVAGETIALFDGLLQVGAVVVGGDGTWSVTSSTLAIGAHTLTAIQSDLAGNPSPSSAGLALTIAAVPATATALALSAASDSGTLLDGATDVTMPVITGSGVAGGTIALFDGLTQIGTATVDGDGAWSITASALAVGVHTLTAIQSDAAGNPSPASTGLALTIAAIPAAATGLALAPASDSGTLLDGITEVAAPIIVGSGVAGDSVALFDGPTAIGTAVVGGDGTWSITASTLAVGAHTLTAIQSDPAGNPSPVSAGLALTIAAVPAAPTGLTLSPASDSGTLLDGATDIAAPVITGSGAAGDTIALFDGAALIGTAIVGSDGNWSIASSTLAVGPHTLSALQSDPAGNPSLASTGLALTIAAVPASPTGLTLAPASDSGTLLDGATDIATPMITGSGVAGDTITLFDGATQIGMAVVGDDGIWSITSSTLATGSHVLTGIESDLAGNPSLASGGLALTIAAVPVAPSDLTLSSAADSGTLLDGITDNTTPVITGSGIAGDTIALFDGTAQVGTVIVGGDGTWSVTTTALSIGPHTLSAIQSDPAGNPSLASVELALTISPVPAAPAGLTLAPASDSGTLLDDRTDIATPVITGSGVAGDTIALFDGETEIGTAIVGGDGTWSIAASILSTGPHALTAIQTDVAGNPSPSSSGLLLTIDTVPAAPADLTLAPASDTGTLLDSITDLPAPVIIGTGVAGYVMTLFDGSMQIGTAIVGGDGSWAVTASVLAVGPHTLTAVQNDAAGNVSVASTALVLTIDAVPAAPGGLILAPASDSGTLLDGITDTATPVITGNGAAGDTVALFDGQTQIGNAIVGGDGAWSITTSTLAAGSHTVTAVQRDPAGNPSPASAGLALTIVAVPAAPTDLALAPSSDSGTVLDGITDITTPMIDGHGVAGDRVALFDGATQVGTAIVGGDGIWTVTTDVLAVGAHVLSAIQNDPAGNASPASTGLALTIAAPPAAATGLNLVPVSDTGALLDGITDIATPVIMGGGVAGNTVALFDGETQVGSSVVGSDGGWTITTSALAVGPHTLTAVQRDPAGNAGPSSAGLFLTIAAVPPAATGLALSPASDSGTLLDNRTTDSAPVITGSGIAGDAIALFDAAIQVGAAIVGGDGTWSVTSSTLTAGRHTLTAVQSDPSGNPAPVSAGLALTIDAIPAAAAGLALSPASDSGTPLDGITDITAPVITGSGTAGFIVGLFDGMTPVGTAIVGNDGSWAIASTALGIGAHTLTAVQTDPAGNVAAASAGFALTIAAVPASAIGLTLAPASDTGTLLDGITDITAPIITGNGVAGDGIALFDGEAQIGAAIVGGDGTWAITASTLATGSHTLTAVQTDPAGNPSPRSAGLALAIAAVPAAAAGLSLAPKSDSGAPGDGITNVTMPVITGSGIAGDTIALFEGADQAGSAAVAIDGSWAITSETLADGSHTLTAIQSDPSGNPAPASLGLTFIVDAIPPAVSAALAANPQNGNGVVYPQILAGSGDPNATVTVSDSSTVIGSAQADATGAWSFDLSSLAVGQHALTANEVDAAGNSSTTSAVPFTVADTRFGLATGDAATSGNFFGSDYSGPVSNLQAQFGYVGSDDVTVTAAIPNVFIYGGDGDDALQVAGGTNVIDGGGGSNWMVGGSGADGGTDTFFVDNRNGQATWSTVLNFHAGDMLTIWGFNAANGTTNWSDGLGAPGYTGATLQAGLGDGTGGVDVVTFAGSSIGSGNFVTTVGTSGGLDYLAVIKTA